MKTATTKCTHERRRRYYWTGTMFTLDSRRNAYGEEDIVNQGMTESCADCGVEIMSDESVPWTENMQQKIQDYIDSYKHKIRKGDSVT